MNSENSSDFSFSLKITENLEESQSSCNFTELRCLNDSNSVQKVIPQPVKGQISCQSILVQKYATTEETYSSKVINDIISNESTRIVAIFKDYLIQDDMSDFMRRYYTAEESVGKIGRLTDYYNTYCTVFPNYITLEERGYLYKNIIRKQ